MLSKSESMSRKTYSDVQRQKLERNRSFVRHPPAEYDSKSYFEPPFPLYETSYAVPAYADALLYGNDLYTQDARVFEDAYRHRALSFTNAQEPVGGARRSGRSIRDRNRRRQSYNPTAYAAAESSSSESECASLGSVDAEWRRRRRLSSLSVSNTSIRSDMGKRGRNYLKPEAISGKMLGRSPPPSNTVLSGLSPTSVTRCQRVTLVLRIRVCRYGGRSKINWLG